MEAIEFYTRQFKRGSNARGVLPAPEVPTTTTRICPLDQLV